MADHEGKLDAMASSAGSYNQTALLTQLRCKWPYLPPPPGHPPHPPTHPDYKLQVCSSGPPAKFCACGEFVVGYLPQLVQWRGREEEGEDVTVRDSEGAVIKSW